MADPIDMILLYVFAGLPIGLFWFMTSWSHDLGLILLSDILIFHVVVPRIMWRFRKYTRLEENYRGVTVNGRENDFLITLGIFVACFLAWTFLDPIGFDSATLLLPKFKTEIITYVYWVVVFILFVLIFSISEHNFYFGFILQNLPGNIWLHGLIVSALNALKWYMMFMDCIKGSTAAIFFAAMFAVVYFVIAYNNDFALFYAGSSMRQLLYLLLSVVFIAYCLGLKLKHPGSVQNYSGDNILSKLI